jgi:hypothetical protein
MYEYNVCMYLCSVMYFFAMLCYVMFCVFVCMYVCNV